MGFKRYEGIDNPNEFYRNQEGKPGFIPWVAVAFAIINVLVYFVLEIMGDTLDPDYMISVGALYRPCVEEQKEWYRFLTACFLHFGFSHLLNNMFMLVIAATFVEKALGRIKFCALYLLSGLGGMIGTYFIRGIYMAEEESVIAGASGAVFGLFGALLSIAIISRGRFENLKGRKLLIMIVLTLYYGYAEGGVDVWGHFFGLLIGTIICIPMAMNSKALKY